MTTPARILSFIQNVRLLRQNLTLRFRWVHATLDVTFDELSDNRSPSIEAQPAGGLDERPVKVPNSWEIGGRNVHLNSKTRSGLHYLRELAEVGIPDAEESFGKFLGKTYSLYSNGDIAEVSHFHANGIHLGILSSYIRLQDCADAVPVEGPPEVYDAKNHTGESKHESANRANGSQKVGIRKLHKAQRPQRAG